MVHTISAYYVVIGGCLGGLLSGVVSRESAAVSRRLRSTVWAIFRLYGSMVQCPNYVIRLYAPALSPLARFCAAPQ